MELTLYRTYKGENYTIGDLYIDNVWFSNTIEDKVRELKSEKDKVYAQTAIPVGRYKVILSYSPHFKRILPEVLNVPYFKYIRIHNGKDENSSAGCIIVGENKVKGKVINSKITINKLMDILTPVWNKKEDIWLTIIEKNGL